MVHTSHTANANGLLSISFSVKLVDRSNLTFIDWGKFAPDLASLCFSSIQYLGNSPKHSSIYSWNSRAILLKLKSPTLLDHFFMMVITSSSLISFRNSSYSWQHIRIARNKSSTSASPPITKGFSKRSNNI